MRTAILLGALALAACAAPGPSPEGTVHPARDVPTPASSGFGVLVMAHGGGPEWDRSVAEAVAPLRGEVPTRLAYGMASPRTLRAALDSLRQDGVTHVAVVRMFLSGRSFLDQTEYFLGLSDQPPASFLLMDHAEGAHGGAGAAGHAAHGGASPAPIEHGLTLATHAYGMLESDEAAQIMRARAAELSRAPAAESVLLRAHGMGDEGENDEVLAVMSAISGSLEHEGFTRVRAATLREDWDEKRAEAEEQIRTWDAAEAAEGRRVLVLPMRLSGFGPYAEVLEGLSYAPGDGLLPHPAIQGWIRQTAVRVACTQGWRTALAPCPHLADDRTGSSPR